MASELLTAKEHADQLESLAVQDAAQKLVVLAKAVRAKFSEASRIPAGCGCTPFWADARHAEARLQEHITEFAAKYSLNKLKPLAKYTPLEWFLERRVSGERNGGKDV